MVCFEALLFEKAAYVRASRKDGYRTLSPWIRRELNRAAACAVHAPANKEASR